MKLPLWMKIVSAVVVIALGLFLLRPEPVTVETGTVEPRSFFEAVEAQGRTRARNPYLIAAPVTGRLLRITLEEGDRVSSGQLLANIAPPPQDQRTSALAQASVRAAEARLQVAESALAETRSALARVTRELGRREELFRQGLASAEETEMYRQLATAEQARVTSAQASAQAAMAEVESAEALLLGTTADDTGQAPEATIEIRSPVDGTVYTVLERNERVVPVGTPILEISNQDNLEVIIDILTQDAVQIEAGDPVYLTGWGGDRTLNAIVRTVEPEAYTKISALGVEEQRVNVIVDLVDVPENLGAEYRVEAAIVTWQAAETLTIPTSAIFQRSNGWNTFVVADGRAQLTPAIIGARNRDYTRVLGGVSAGDEVVLYPSDLIEDGSRLAR